ncbi:KH domain-containing protein / zinc finger family protein isoform 1 [Hibiscus syriacus]|uniref:KH domain-containing protein / zinc finger family protein isoform 1 n=1 Tax=Hibiscus syriacus TaxID=106335 RepID=A0A6A2X723_HIBSY|nr:GATA transcription factor 29-like [Hibiscus syriacus]KAE8657836.1 KH domain-containing protein / zinc finger family protein isoform 1 [Hibiscus syriacus]
MDNSRSFSEMNKQDNSNDRVDLSLTLGLPLSDFHQNATLYHHTQHGLVNQGAIVEGQQSFNGSQARFAWPSDQLGRGVHNMNYANAFNPFSDPSMGLPSYGTIDSSSYNFAPTRPLPPPNEVPPNTYTLIDVPPRRAAANQHHLEIGNSSASGSGGQVPWRFGTYNDPFKRCTNYNCNTNDTPMWRKGPLGPKTLCNACGIKYRKEEEKKKGKEAKSRGRRSNPEE